MPFKMVTDSEKAAGRIASTAMAHAELIAEAEATRWKDRLPEGQEDVSILQLQRFHAEDLLRLRQELCDKEAAHLAQLHEIREARKRRDAAAPRLRTELYAYRDMFDLTYGKDASWALFTEKPVVPVDATPLRRVGVIVVANLEDPELQLPPAVREGSILERPKIAGAIREPLEEMEKAMLELEDLLPMASGTLGEKHAALAAVDEKTTVFARFLEGLYGLQGEDELAARVRASSHRSQEESAEAMQSEEGDRVEGAREAAPSATAPVATAPVAAASELPGERRERGGPGVTTSERVVSPRSAAGTALPLAEPEGARVAGGQRSLAATAKGQVGAARRSATGCPTSTPSSR